MKYKKINKTYSFDKELLERLDAYSFKSHLKKSNIVEIALRKFLNERERDENKDGR